MRRANGKVVHCRVDAVKKSADGKHDPETGQPITEAVNDEIQRRYPDRNERLF